jgi:hypothetical protein
MWGVVNGEIMLSTRSAKCAMMFVLETCNNLNAWIGWAAAATDQGQRGGCELWLLVVCRRLECTISSQAQRDNDREVKVLARIRGFAGEVAASGERE